MRILGIDPGLQTTGFGVIDADGGRLQYVASGTIRTTAQEMGNLPARLKVLFDGIREITERYTPDSASVEIVFVNVNPQSTLLLGQARGACVTALVAQSLPVAEYTALQMKKAVVGSGRADKTRRARQGRGRRAGSGHYACPRRPGHGAAGRGHTLEPQRDRHVPRRPHALSLTQSVPATGCARGSAPGRNRRSPTRSTSA
jgi:crossover junction endodeoxyribonuclease RuvC